MERWRLVHSEAVVDTRWITVRRNTYDTPAGLVPDYFVLSRCEFVLVVAADADALLLVRQYRPATDKFYLSLPGGYLEPGETPAMAAKRELLEETGAEGTGWDLLGKLHPLPGYVSSAAHVFGCDVVPGCDLRPLDTAEGLKLSDSAGERPWR